MTLLAVWLLATGLPGCANNSGGDGAPTGTDDPGDFAFADETDPNVQVQVEQRPGTSGPGATDPDGPTELRVRAQDPTGRPLRNVSVDVIGTELYDETNVTAPLPSPT